MGGEEKLVSIINKSYLRWKKKHSATIMTWRELLYISVFTDWKSDWTFSMETWGESQSHLITPGRVTVKLRSAIRLVFVGLLCGQFCHSLGCNAIHLKQIVCPPTPWNIEYNPPQGLQIVGKILGMDHKLIPCAPIFCSGEMKFECA